MPPPPLLHADLTDQILKAFFHVHRTLGHGFLEKVYQNALLLTLAKAGVPVQSPVPLKVYFEGEVVGDYVADLVVAERVLLELKAASDLAPAHEAQLLNYLKATNIEVGLLLNFGPKPQFRRKIFHNDRKDLGSRPRGDPACPPVFVP